MMKQINPTKTNKSVFAWSCRIETYSQFNRDISKHISSSFVRALFSKTLKDTQHTLKSNLICMQN